MRRSTREHGHAVTVEKATPAPSQALRAPKHSELAGTTRGGVATIPKGDNQSLRVGARERESGGERRKRQEESAWNEGERWNPQHLRRTGRDRARTGGGSG